MVRCPKCRATGSRLILHEVWDGFILEFEQDDKGAILKQGICLSRGDPSKVKGICLRCNHRWTLRRVTQIVNLAGHPDHEMYD